MATDPITPISAPNYSVPALDKGLDVLEALASSAKPLTLAELSRTLQRSSSALFRTVDALEKRSYIVRDPLSGAYRLTLRLYELAHTHSPLDDLLRASLFPMRELSGQVGETCSLAVLNRGKLVVVAEELSRERVRLSVEIGSQVPPLRTVSGRLLVAFLEPSEQESFLRADADYNALSEDRRKLLLDELRTIQQTGHIVAQSDFRVGLDLAALVGNPSSGVTASLAIPCLAGGRNEGREMELLDTLRQCAHAITRTLGLTPAISTPRAAGAASSAAD